MKKIQRVAKLKSPYLHAGLQQKNIVIAYSITIGFWSILIVWLKQKKKKSTIGRQFT